MKTSLRAVITFVLLLGAVRAIAQQQPSLPKTIPDSIDYMWKMVEGDFTALAEAMPEEKWSFKPTKGAFADVRTFAEGSIMDFLGVLDRRLYEVELVKGSPESFRAASRSRIGNSLPNLRTISMSGLIKTPWATA